ncbi:uncharacterized protein [Haliotis cracherodii]|uniref:uncharacterized protein n=1 Tax=Haliotis cracherodii TaxID=6455 RepID=UPI0039E7C1DC
MANRTRELLGPKEPRTLDFEIVKRPFHQLLTIHAFVRAGSNFKLMPLVFVIMSRSRTSDCVKVSKKLLAFTYFIVINE